MNKLKKALLPTLCVLLLAGASIWTTLAYLTDSETVLNTFTVGSVGLTLDEAKVHPDGTYVTNASNRVQANEYHLIPGHEYIKDPVIHVDPVSESSYIFVRVENGIAAYEAPTTTGADPYMSIADQIADNGWTALGGVENVYYQTYTKGQDDKDLEVFGKFKIDGMANAVNGWSAISPETTTVSVTGYAVQRDGFSTAEAAWAATFGQSSGSGDSEKLEYTINLHETDSVLLEASYNLYCNKHYNMYRIVNMIKSEDGIWSASFNNSLPCRSEECTLEVWIYYSKMDSEGMESGGGTALDLTDLGEYDCYAE